MQWPFQVDSNPYVEMVSNTTYKTSLRSLLSHAGIALSYLTASINASPIAGGQQPIGAPTARLGQGVVTGTVWSMERDYRLPNEIEAFLGIRYGQAPKGDLRFKASKLASGSGDNIDATGYGWSCPSPGSPQPWSEDCLFVNIFRPRNTKSDAKLPVAVYIHGGAFHAGAGKQRIMEVFTKSLKGSTLSKFTGSVHDSASMLSYSQNPFIIVNFNYRLGAFGFLGSKIAKEDNSLNAGLHDQVLLLEWLQKNIAAFGGDPDQVTLMGVSAGAHSIGHLITYKYHGKPLFHRAILEDGAATARIVAPYDNELVETQFKELVTQVGCKNAGIDVMKCLREKDANILFSASEAVFNKYNPSNRWAFQPVVDGDIIAEPPVKSLKSGNWNKVPIITGFTTNEGSPFVPKKMKTNQEFVDYMKALVPKMDNSQVKELQRLYPDPLANPSSPYKDTRPIGPLGLGPQFKRIESAYGEFAYVCPVRDTAIYAAKASEPIFLYHFAVNKSVIDGAPHAMITEYETFSSNAWACPRAPDYEKCKWSQMTIAGTFHNYLCSFIVTGNPNKADTKWKTKPEWKQYQPDSSDSVMWFGKDSDDRAGGSSSGTPAVMGDDKFAAENCKFWWKIRPLTE